MRSAVWQYDYDVLEIVERLELNRQADGTKADADRRLYESVVAYEGRKGVAIVLEMLVTK